VTGAPLGPAAGTSAHPPSYSSAGSSSAASVGASSANGNGGHADREPAVVHEPSQRFVELPPEPRSTPRPTPRPIVVDDDLDVPDFLK
jgi:hypothetical protein